MCNRLSSISSSAEPSSSSRQILDLNLTGTRDESEGQKCCSSEFLYLYPSFFFAKNLTDCHC